MRFFEKLKDLLYAPVVLYCLIRVVLDYEQWIKNIDSIGQAYQSQIDALQEKKEEEDDNDTI